MTSNSFRLGRKLTHALAGPSRTSWADPTRLISATNLPWRRYAKFGLAAALLAVGALTTYQQMIVRVSREAVINARVTTIRAPMDGILKTTSTTPGRAVQAGAPIGDIEDPMADDARVFQLQQDTQTTEREHNALTRRLADLRQSRAEADLADAQIKNGLLDIFDRFGKTVIDGIDQTQNARGEAGIAADDFGDLRRITLVRGKQLF